MSGFLGRPSSGSGDMRKAVYDTDLDNIVDESERLESSDGTVIEIDEVVTKTNATVTHRYCDYDNGDDVEDGMSWGVCN